MLYGASRMALLLLVKARTSTTTSCGLESVSPARTFYNPCNIVWIMVAATSSQGEGFDFLAKGKAHALKCAKALNQQLRVVFNSAFLFVGYKIVPEVIQD